MKNPYNDFDEYGLRHLPEHLMDIALWETLEQILTDLAFIAAKCAHGMTYNLVNNYHDVLGTLKTDMIDLKRYHIHDDILKTFLSFVKKESNNLERFSSLPSFVYQQAYNYASTGVVLTAWELLRDKQLLPGHPWIQLFNRSIHQNISIAVLDKHVNCVTDCAFSKNGNILVSSSHDTSIMLWNGDTWEFGDIFALLKDKVITCDISQDGTNVVSGCADGYVYIHHIPTKNIMICEEKFEKAPLRCRFFHDGKRILSVGDSGIMIHNVETGKLIQRLNIAVKIFDCDFCAEGLIALACSDGELKLYDVARNIIVKNLHTSEMGKVFACSFSHRWNYLLATGGHDIYLMDVRPYGIVAMWDVKDWQEIKHHKKKFPSLSMGCTFFADDDFYTVGLWNGEFKVFRTADGQHIRTVRGHSANIRAMNVSPTGKELVTASFDHQLKVWNTTSLVQQESQIRVDGDGLFCAFSKDGKYGFVWVAEIENFVCKFSCIKYEFSSLEAFPVGVTALEPNFKLAEQIKLARRDPRYYPEVTEILTPEIDISGGHRTCPFSYGHTYWLIGCSARLYPFEYHLLPELLPKHFNHPPLTWTRAFDGTKDAIVHPGVLSVYSIEDGYYRLIRDMEFEWDIAIHSVPQCSFSRDGNKVYFIYSTTLYIVDIFTSQVTSCSTLEGEVMHAFCESPNKQQILAACDDGSLHSWNIQSGQELQKYSGHRGTVVDCAYINNDWFISIGDDGTLRLWHVNEQEHQALFIADAQLSAFSISPSKKHVMAVDIHGQVYPLGVTGIPEISLSMIKSDVSIQPDISSSDSVNLSELTSDAFNLVAYLENDVKNLRSLENKCFFMCFLAKIIGHANPKTGEKLYNTARSLGVNPGDIFTYSLHQITFITMQVEPKQYALTEQITEVSQVIRGTARIVNELDKNRCQSAYNIAKRFIWQRTKNVILAGIYGCCVHVGEIKLAKEILEQLN